MSSPTFRAVCLTLPLILVLLEVCSAVDVTDDASDREKRSTFRSSNGLSLRGRKDAGGESNALDGSLLNANQLDQVLSGSGETPGIMKRSYHQTHGWRRGKRSTPVKRYHMRERNGMGGVLSSNGGTVSGGMNQTSSKRSYRGPVRYSRSTELRSVTEDDHSATGDDSASGFRGKRMTSFYGQYLRHKEESNAGTLNTNDGKTADLSVLNPKVLTVDKKESNKRYRHYSSEFRGVRSVPLYGRYSMRHQDENNDGTLNTNNGKTADVKVANPKVATVDKTETNNRYLRFYGGFRGKRSARFSGFYMRHQDENNDGTLNTNNGKTVDLSAVNPEIANVNKKESNKRYRNYYSGFRSKRMAPLYGRYYMRHQDENNDGTLNTNNGKTVDAAAGNPKVATVDKTETNSRYLKYYGGYRSKRNARFSGFHMRHQEENNDGTLNTNNGKTVDASAANPGVASVKKTETNNRYLKYYSGFRSKRMTPYSGKYYMRHQDENNDGTLNTNNGKTVDAKVLNPKVGTVDKAETNNRYRHFSSGFRSKRMSNDYVSDEDVDDEESSNLDYILD